MRQNVFRNEGRFNWGDLTRLQDYNIREIVFIGDHDYVLSVRKKLIDSTIELFSSLDMKFDIRSASDMFVIPSMQKYKLFQEYNEAKYELQINRADELTCACASFNIHGNAFSNKFHFKVKNVANTESGCVGFGLERIIITFLNQFGIKRSKWPHLV